MTGKNLVILNFSFFHSVQRNVEIIDKKFVKLLELNSRIYFSYFFRKNFVKAMVSLKKLLIVDLTNFFLVSHIALWKNENSLRISLSLKKSRQINSLVISFSKTIAFTKFLRKKCEREFLQFPQLCTLWKLRKFSLPLFWQKFCESKGFCTKELISQKNQWNRISRFSTLCCVVVVTAHY